MFTCQSNDLSQFNTDLTILKKVDTYMYRISRSISDKPFCFSTRCIQKSHTIMTLVLTKTYLSKNQEILRLSFLFFFNLISFNTMVGLMSKQGLQLFFSKLGWRRGCIFEGVVCVSVRGGYIYIYISWVVGVFWKGVNVLEGRGEEKLHHYPSSYQAFFVTQFTTCGWLPTPL